MSDFHKERMTGIGGSDAAAALGLSPWRSPYSLWLEKIGQDEPQPQTEPMLWGRLLEEIIAHEYTRRTGRVVEQSALMRHKNHAFMIGHIDGRVVGDPERIIEIKTSRDGRGWGEPGSADIPLAYLCQTHHYLTICGAAYCDVAVLIAGHNLRIYEICRDDDISNLLIDQEATFWQYVERREPPPPVQLSDVVHRWGRLAPRGVVVADRVELMAIEELRRIRDHRLTLDEMEQANKSVVLQKLAKAEALVDDSGNVLATWRLDRGRAAYSVAARDPQRRFLLKA